MDPERPATLVKVIVRFADCPGSKEAEVELALILKSGGGTVTWTVAECDIVPLLPVTVTLYCAGFVPFGIVTISVAVADLTVEENLTIPGLTLTTGPPGEVLVTIDTLPDEPSLDTMLIIEVLVEPWSIISEERLDETEKSGVGWTMKLPFMEKR